MGFAGHQLGYFVQTDITQRNGGIAVLQEFVNGFALIQTSDSTVLPVNRANIGANTHEGIVTAHERFVAQIQTFVQQFPEGFLVTLCENTDLRQVQADNTLVEATLKLVVSVFIFPRGQEAAAAHWTEHVALVMLPHFLCRDVVRVQPLGGAFDCQLGDVVVLAALQAVMLVQYIHQFWECRGDVNTLVIFNALVPLAQNLFDDGCVFFNVWIVLIQVKEQGYKWRLSVCGHQRIDLILNGLHAGTQLPVFLPFPEKADRYWFL